MPSQEAQDFHIDNSLLGTFQETPEGFLRVEAIVGVVGELVYVNQDGKERIEIVTPEVLFDPISMDSFTQKPITKGHHGAVLPANSRGLIRGATGQVARIGDGVLGLSTVIFDDELIADIKSGDRPEVSSGYFAKTKARDDGKFVQQFRYGNHLASVPRGRAGPKGRFVMDGADDEAEAIPFWELVEHLKFDRAQLFIPSSATSSPKVQSPEEIKMTEPVFKINLDGAEFTVAQQLHDRFSAWTKTQTETANAATLRADAADSALATLKTEHDALQGRFDAMTEELKAAKESSIDQKEIAARVETLLKIAPQAAELKLSLDSSLSSIELKRLWLTAKGFPVEGKADAYVEGRFDAMQESGDVGQAQESGSPNSFEGLMGLITQGRKSTTNSDGQDYRATLRGRIDGASKAK